MPNPTQGLRRFDLAHLRGFSVHQTSAHQPAAPTLDRGLRAQMRRRTPKLYAGLLALRDVAAPWHAEREIRLLALLVDPEAIAVDVGTSTGLYTHWLLRYAKRVISVEPNPVRLPNLRLRFGQALAEGRMTLLDFALSDRPGPRLLWVPSGAEGLASFGNNAGDEDGAIPVETRTLDDLDLRGVGFLKIDVEGHEVEVLDGARQTLARERPVVLVEAEERHRPGAVAAVRQRLEPLGYQGFYMGKRKLIPIESFDPAVHQRLDALDQHGMHRRPGAIYVNNFVFLAREDVRDRLRRRRWLVDDARLS